MISSERWLGYHTQQIALLHNDAGLKRYSPCRLIQSPRLVLLEVGVCEKQAVSDDICAEATDIQAEAWHLVLLHEGPGASGEGGESKAFWP